MYIYVEIACFFLWCYRCVVNKSFQWLNVHVYSIVARSFEMVNGVTGVGDEF